ncbi:hypothetical protein ACSBR2_001334 [Camellia fascicularis]
MCCTCSLSCVIGCSSGFDLGSDNAFVFKISSDFLCDFAIVYTRVTHYIEMAWSFKEGKEVTRRSISCLINLRNANCHGDSTVATTSIGYTKAISFLTHFCQRLADAALCVGKILCRRFSHFADTFPCISKTAFCCSVPYNDAPHWNGSCSGNFSTVAAYKIIAQQDENGNYWSWIWKIKTPQKRHLAYVAREITNQSTNTYKKHCS